jgi:hypothetical protein
MITELGRFSYSRETASAVAGCMTGRSYLCMTLRNSSVRFRTQLSCTHHTGPYPNLTSIEAIVVMFHSLPLSKNGMQNRTCHSHSSTERAQSRDWFRLQQTKFREQYIMPERGAEGKTQLLNIHRLKHLVCRIHTFSAPCIAEAHCTSPHLTKHSSISKNAINMR